MTTFLLDVNVLIALVDPAHIQDDNTHQWFSQTGNRSFATCPITENGLLRIVGHPQLSRLSGSTVNGRADAGSHSCAAGSQVLAGQHQHG